MPADARREPPSDAGHGGGRPPDGPPEEGSWAFARGLKSMFGLRAQNDYTSTSSLSTLSACENRGNVVHWPHLEATGECMQMRAVTRAGLSSL